VYRINKLKNSQVPAKGCRSIIIIIIIIIIKIKGKGKAIRVTGREGPQGCETSKVPHFV
jgi:hypothetical protein